MGIKSTREAAVNAIIELAEKDERILIVSPDAILAGRLLPFMQSYPNRVIEVGIAEQNAVNVAAGLASTGMIPIVISYAGFLTMRACEMIRTFIAYPGLNVKLIGLNGGMLGGGREGVTHQFYEDIGILRSMPGVKILAPADASQAYKAAKSMLKQDGPIYLRLGSGREPEVFEEDTPFEFGKIREITVGSDVSIFASGFIMNRALAATEQLRNKGISVTLADVSTIKPLDYAKVKEILDRTGCAVTVEDHNRFGGLYSAICEAACEMHPCRVKAVALNDIYPRSGKAAELLDAYGISVDDIVRAAKEVMAG